MMEPSSPAPDDSRPPHAPPTVERLAARARTMSGWLRFMGVITIAASIPSVLSIIGIVFAWLPIWLGVLLFQAGTAARRGTDDELIRMVEKLRTFFIIQSIVVIVALVAFALMFGLFGTLLFEMMREMGTGPTWEA